MVLQGNLAGIASTIQTYVPSPQVVVVTVGSHGLCLDFGIHAANKPPVSTVSHDAAHAPHQIALLDIDCSLRTIEKIRRSSDISHIHSNRMSLLFKTIPWPSSKLAIGCTQK